MAKRILITEKVAQEAIDALKGRGYEVDVKLKLTPKQLREEIVPYDALIVRSATKVDKDLLDVAENLKIIGRAGVTVDNIDLEAAVDHDIVVCNAPSSNIISAAEHTIALMFACARLIPQANALVHSGGWERHRFMGTELFGKTLAIFGLGRVGSAVAERARALGMEVIAYDPYCSDERAAKLGVTLCGNIDDVISVADIITVHLPRTLDTVGMFGANEFDKMKTGVILINSARAGIYDMDSLADFVAAGKIGAVAIDVFDPEPCTDSPLHEFENVILTPHISAVTRDAQIRAGQQIAEYVWQGLEGSIVPTAINPTTLPPEVINDVRPYARSAKMLGSMLVDILGQIPKNVEITLKGSISDADPNMIIAGVVDGIVSYKNIGIPSIEDTMARAERHGISVSADSSPDAGSFESALFIQADDARMACTLYGLDRSPRIINFLDYDIDIAPARNSVVFEYVDGPGRIGIIGTVLGNADVNITTMQIGAKPEEKCALVYMNIEGELPESSIDELKSKIEIKNVWKLSL